MDTLTYSALFLILTPQSSKFGLPMHCQSCFNSKIKEPGKLIWKNKVQQLCVAGFLMSRAGKIKRYRRRQFFAKADFPWPFSRRGRGL